MTVGVLLSFVLGLTPALAFAAEPGPPPSPAKPVTEVLHGVALTDPYRWLEDRQSPETRDWVKAQNAYARSYLDALPGRDRIRSRLAAMQKPESRTVPLARGGRYFFQRRLATEVRDSICMRSRDGGPEEVLVSPTALGMDANSSVELASVRNDGNSLAFRVRRGGEDEAEVRFLNIESRKLMEDRLPRARYFSVVLTPDGGAVYYSRFQPGVGSRVYVHKFGASEPDGEVFGAGYGPEQLVRVAVSQTGRWLVLSMRDGVPARRTEIFVQDLSAGTPPMPVIKEADEWEPRFAGDFLLLQTNWKAPNVRVLRVDLLQLGAAAPIEVVPETSLPIQAVSAANGRVFVKYLKDVATRIQQFDVDGKPLGELKLPSLESATVPAGLWTDEEAFYTFTSVVVPTTIYRLQTKSGAQSVWFRPTIPVRTDRIAVKQVFYPSRKDGTKVPMFVVHRKGMRLDGNRPVMLVGYGGFNVSLEPVFDSWAAWWTEQGGVFAMANIRGGGEYGERWHRAGMFEHKQNVFDDFSSAAEWLIANGYTRPARIGIAGGSNGGLLVGALLTQRPELVGAVVCAVPLLDMVRFHKLSVGKWWATEYGSADDPKQFPYLLKYSPYHNVRKGTTYPPTLFLTGDADTRVDPAHARKMTAMLQSANQSSNPILLRYELETGHSGRGNIEKSLDEHVDMMSFFSDRLGVPVTADDNSDTPRRARKRR